MLKIIEVRKKIKMGKTMVVTKSEGKFKQT